MWYAAQVRSNFEGIVSQVLTDRHIENFWPFKERTDWRKRVFRRPYFPGYVFLQSDLASNASRHEIIAVPQVVRLLGHGDEPEAIPDSEIFSVRQVARLAAELEFVPEAVERFHQNDKVRVRFGPLEGCEGYVSYLKNQTRLVILIEALNQAVSTEVDASMLVVVEQAKKQK